MILLALGFYERYKVGSDITFSSVVMLSLLRCFTQPEGMLSIDYFHNGEITMPMQQLMSYGKLPYLDVIPIHGLCDYYYGVINYLFFDGSYMALNASKVVGDLLAAMLLASVIWFFVKDKRQGLFLAYFFIPYVVRNAGMRYWFLLILFAVMFSHKVKKGMQSLYAWTLLSIIAIAWNASIGGAAAVAFLPMVLYRLKRDFSLQFDEFRHTEKKRRIVIGIAWGALFVLGIAFIPLFLQIARYLAENTGTTLYVNGMEMFSEVSEVGAYLVPGIVNEKGMFFVTAFSFVIPLFVCFIYAFQKKKTGAGEMFVTYLTGFLVLINYAFVRYDEGLRAGVLGVIFLVITAVTFLHERAQDKSGRYKEAAAIYTAFLSLAILLSGISPTITAETMVLEREIPAYVDASIMGQDVEDPVVYVSGDSVDIPQLGTGFVQGNTLLGIQNLHTVTAAVTKQGKTIFDITNAVANAVIFDLPSYLPYSSAYNISNAVMQEKAISMLEKNLPDVILAAPEIRFDDAPFSYRCMELYRYLMSKDYVPYKYENVIYLVRGENPVEGAQQNAEAFAQLMHKKYLGYLPAVYGANSEEIGVQELFEQTDKDYRIVATETGFCVEFDEPLSGSEICAIKMDGLSLKKETNGHGSAEQSVTVTMEMESDVSSDKRAEFEFALDGDVYLLPVICSPYFTQQEEIRRLDFKSEHMDELLWDSLELEFYK